MNTPLAHPTLRAINGGKKTEAQQTADNMARITSCFVFNDDGLCDFDASCKNHQKSIRANIHWFTLFVDRLAGLCCALDNNGMSRAAQWISALITYISGISANSGYPWYYDLKHGASAFTMRQHLNSGLWKMHARLGFTMDDTPGFIARNFLKRYKAPIVPAELQEIADMLCSKPKPTKRFFFF